MRKVTEAQLAASLTPLELETVRRAVNAIMENYIEQRISEIRRRKNEDGLAATEEAAATPHRIDAMGGE